MSGATRPAESASALDGTLFHQRFSGSWAPATALQGTTRLRPALAVGPTGSLEVAITGADGIVAHNRRLAGRWLGWQSLGFHSALAPALIYNTDADTLELAAVGTEPPGKTLLVKRGAEGFMVEGASYPSLATEIVDTTGAGDALAAGYLVGGAALAAEAAARCVAKLGAMP